MHVFYDEHRHTSTSCGQRAGRLPSSPAVRLSSTNACGPQPANARPSTRRCKKGKRAVPFMGLPRSTRASRRPDGAGAAAATGRGSSSGRNGALAVVRARRGRPDMPCGSEVGTRSKQSRCLFFYSSEGTPTTFRAARTYQSSIHKLVVIDVHSWYRKIFSYKH